MENWWLITPLIRPLFLVGVARIPMNLGCFQVVSNYWMVCWVWKALVPGVSCGPIVPKPRWEVMLTMNLILDPL